MGASLITRHPRALFLAALLGAALLSGCTLSYSHVKPWQRDMLTRPGMQVNAEPMVSACDEHIYFSREASKGGQSYAGGGCGCN